MTPAGGPALLVAIDTEGDNQWDLEARRNQRFENIYALGRLHEFFARHGVERVNPQVGDTFDAHLLDQGWNRTRAEQSCPTDVFRSVKVEDRCKCRSTGYGRPSVGFLTWPAPVRDRIEFCLFSMR